MGHIQPFSFQAIPLFITKNNALTFACLRDRQEIDNFTLYAHGTCTTGVDKQNTP